MSRERYSAEQMISMLRQAEIGANMWQHAAYDV